MDKKYSNCPLKKRPIYVIHEETDADIEIDNDTKPVDLSSWRIKEEKVPFELNEEASPINYSKTRYSPKTKKIEVVKEKDYNFLPSHSWDSKDVQNPDKRCNNRYFNHQKPQSLDGYNYSRIPIPSPPRSDLNSPLEFREYSVSPVPLTGNYSEFNNTEYYCESRNYNNNLIKQHEDEEVRGQEIRFSGDNQLLSPSPSHISYGSGLSDFGDYSEPEDLSVKNKRKVLVPTDSNANIQRIETGYSEKSSSDLYFQCRICNKCYSTYLGLMKHQQSHSIPQEFRSNPQYNTSVVIPGTNLRSSLANNSDKQVVSSNDTNRTFGAPRYQCKDCGKSYSTFSGLTKHQQFHCPCAEGNQTKKVFSCKNCDKVYVSLGALKMHIRTHTLPCKCPLCGKAFSRPWLLQGHIRTHTGEKPFTCQHCQRAFADRSNLRAHLQTHSEVKKYCCTSCTKTFSRMSLLTKHLQGGCNGAISASSTSNQNQIVQTQPAPREDLYYDRKGNVYHNLETVKYQNHTYETPLSNNYDRS